MEATNLGKAESLPTIEWTDVETQLADLLTHDDPRSPVRSTFWLTTLNTDGSPHVTSVGALWHKGSCWFQTGERTRKAKNVERDPRCTVSVATKGFDVMVSGEARRVTDAPIVAEIATLWAQSGWPASPTTREPASRHPSTRRRSGHRRGSSTKSSRERRLQSVRLKKRRVRCVGASDFVR